MENKTVVGQRIATARELRSLSAKDLASLLSITPSRLSNWENGVSGVSAEYIYLISEKLNVTSDYLIGLTDNPESRIFDQSDQIRGRLMTSFIQLNTDGQSRVADYAEDLQSSGKYKREDTTVYMPFNEGEYPSVAESTVHYNAGDEYQFAASDGRELTEEERQEAIKAVKEYEAKQQKNKK